jgi:hypothetical protein
VDPDDAPAPAATALPAERVGKDQSIWDRLETVRSTLEKTYFVAAEIFDPEQQD